VASQGARREIWFFQINDEQCWMAAFGVAALRDMPFLRPVALFLAHVQQAHHARNALQCIKNGFIATARISVDRP